MSLSLMLTYPFMQRALIAGTLVSLCAALLGVSLVLKRYSMIGDGLSHVSFGALAVAVALGFTPLFPKDKTGQSMPSRHCFSAAAIVAAAFTVWVPLGVAACLLAAVVAVTRVLTGVHCPSDVLAGLAFGAGAAVIGFLL